MSTHGPAQSATTSADGAVSVHCKTYDGNTSDDQVHRDTWDFLRRVIGHADFLYRVYASTRYEELAPAGWPPEQVEAFLRMQFRAQDTHYRTHFPAAAFAVPYLAAGATAQPCSDAASSPS